MLIRQLNESLRWEFIVSTIKPLQESQVHSVLVFKMQFSGEVQRQELDAFISITSWEHTTSQCLWYMIRSMARQKKTIKMLYKDVAEAVEYDASTASPNLTLVSCDPDLWPFASRLLWLTNPWGGKLFWKLALTHTPLTQWASVATRFG